MLKLVYIYTEDSTVDKYILLYCIVLYCVIILTKSLQFPLIITWNPELPSSDD
jgi:hypothetical protein